MEIDRYGNRQIWNRQIWKQIDMEIVRYGNRQLWKSINRETFFYMEIGRYRNIGRYTIEIDKYRYI